MAKIKPTSNKRRWIKVTWQCEACNHKNVTSAFPKNKEDEEPTFLVSHGWKNCILCKTDSTPEQSQEMLDQVTATALKENMFVK